MSDSSGDLPSLLAQAQAEAERQAREINVQATTDGQTASGEASVAVGGDSWWLRAWAKLTAKRGAKPQGEAGVSFTKRFFRG